MLPGRSCRSAAAAVLILAAGFAAAAADPVEHGHEPLAVDTVLTLSDVVDATLEAFPAALEVGARQQEADAWQSRSRSLVSAQPVVSLRYQTDRFGDDAGLSEIESGIQLALWKWGERKAARRVGEAFDSESAAALVALRWQISGLIRERIWQIASADGQLGIAARSLAVANRLADVIRRRHELGDVALRDLLLAESALLDAEAGFAEAEVALVDAERAYRNLTGLDRRPAFESELLADYATLDDSHPALAFASAQLDRARARRALAEQSGSVSPTLTIGPRRERGQFAPRYEDSIGVLVTIPFGGSSHTATRATEAGRDVASARATMQQAYRELDLAFHEAAHGLDVARHNLELASERAGLAERGFLIGESAYEKGELSLIELLTLQSVLLDAERQVLRFEIETYRQTALHNQALGVLP